MIILISINRGQELILPIFILLSLLIVFLKFNWSPAKIFMGDAGSLFVGINLIIFIIISIKSLLISPIVMLIIFSYCLIDGYGTVLIRLFFKKQWKKRHRSHPYQNFAMTNNHSSISKYVIIFHFFWLLPLSLLANEFKSFQFVVLIISIIPSLIFLKKFGPRYSKD